MSIDRVLGMVDVGLHEAAHAAASDLFITIGEGELLVFDHLL